MTRLLHRLPIYNLGKSQMVQSGDEFNFQGSLQTKVVTKKLIILFIYPPTHTLTYTHDLLGTNTEEVLSLLHISHTFIFLMELLKTL